MIFGRVRLGLFDFSPAPWPSVVWGRRWVWAASWSRPSARSSASPGACCQTPADLGASFPVLLTPATESKDWKVWGLQNQRTERSEWRKVRGWQNQRTERPEWQKGVNDWCLNERIKGWRNQRPERSEDDRIKGLKGQNDKIKGLRGLNDRIKGLKDLNAIKNFNFYCL